MIQEHQRAQKLLKTLLHGLGLVAESRNQAHVVETGENIACTRSPHVFLNDKVEPELIEFRGSLQG
jgi:hypothetical protein